MTGPEPDPGRQATMSDHDHDPDHVPQTDPQWSTEPISWHVANYTPQNPFAAELVIQAESTEIALSLDPASLPALHDALGQVRAAQRAAILGEGTPSAAPAPSDPEPAPDAADDDPQGKTPRRKRKIGLIVIGCIVGLAIVYSMVAGAVLV